MRKMIEAHGMASRYETAAAQAAEWEQTGEVIADHAARAIAAAWQSPGRVGKVLATLASGLPTDVEALRDDIDRTEDEADNRHALDHADRMTFEALRAWVDYRANRHYHTWRGDLKDWYCTTCDTSTDECGEDDNQQE